MGVLEGAISYGMLCFGLLAGASIAFHAVRHLRGRRRLSCLLGAFLFTVGWVSFIGASIAATGGMNWLPSSFEWPAGWSDGVITTSDGRYAVPHESAGRVQMYDSNWRFICGWQTNAYGGAFRLRPGPDGGVLVITARRDQSHQYDRSGALLSTSSAASGEYSSLGNSATSTHVSTPIWGWTLTTPFIAWACGLCGMILFALTRPTEQELRAKKIKRGP